ncbi:hypothetical protein ALSL_1515 [Aerosticca soli]|uniref:Uncharacterized protein n=1 Tax=Aerosticca soli TaxID=2010829 RepID=A0A2Z6E5Z3_9GAMM|nr:hypothetical protein ALSL_1515 [Aerosticca soli]
MGQDRHQQAARAQAYPGEKHPHREMECERSRRTNDPLTVEIQIMDAGKGDTGDQRRQPHGPGVISIYAQQKRQQDASIGQFLGNPGHGQLVPEGFRSDLQIGREHHCEDHQSQQYPQVRAPPTNRHAKTDLCPLQGAECHE